MILKVDFIFDNSRLEFVFEYEESEPKDSASSVMAKNRFFVELPSNLDKKDIHPDHLALSAFLAIRPWLNNSLLFSHPISRRLAVALEEFRLTVGPIDDELQPYDSGKGRYMGLAFSGGADSTAALSVLPSTTVPIFLNRPKVQNSIYSKEAAISACNSLRKIGYNCIMLECDLETIRQPIGFPTDLSNGIPAIILAQTLNLFGISFGTILESLYGIGRLQYKDYEDTSHKKMWWNVFDAAGLPLTFPVGGVSEVGTELICSRAAIGSIAQSCIRGTIGQPCYACWKCFRKNTLRNSLGLEDSDKSRIDKLIYNKEVITKLSAMPISHENVLIYAFSKINNRNYPPPFSDRFAYDKPIDFLERWYSTSAIWIDSRIREEVSENIQKYILSMNNSDEELIIGWNNKERIKLLAPLSYPIPRGV
jgi:hypothetical protein